MVYLFISHDMAVVEQISHRVNVMYAGRFLEMGTRAQIFENPLYPQINDRRAYPRSGAGAAFVLIS